VSLIGQGDAFHSTAKFKTGKTKTMKKLFVATVAAIVLLSGSAFAKQEKQVTRTIWELSDFPELEDKAKAVCESKSALSDKLKAACAAHTFPSVTKGGAFRNAGIGAELNTLIRQ
jgi:hypothetical protein